MAKYFIRTADPMDLQAAAPMLFEPMAFQGAAQPRPYLSTSEPGVAIADLDEQDAYAIRESGAEIFLDLEFSTFPGQSEEYWDASFGAADEALKSFSLDDVLDHIQAPQAWELAKGAGVTIAVVDTGVCGSLSEFPASKRSPLDLPTAFAGQHWNDPKGHGSMCATIAAGTKTLGGRFNGVAPDATVLSARTTLLSSDIYRIYDRLLAARASGELPGPLVISNSYGLYVCDPPRVLPQNHPYRNVVIEAVHRGVLVVFAAGNNHYDVLCNHDPTACTPNTIWAVNSEDEVLSVGTVNRQNSNQDPTTPHANSSRGPGQWAASKPKPDCVAPTYGEVVWGCGYRVMPWWGTSGACPQVAGLAALVLSVRPHLSPAEVGAIIRETCRPLAAAPTCVGNGLIDCLAAVEKALTT